MERRRCREVRGPVGDQMTVHHLLHRAQDGNEMRSAAEGVGSLNPPWRAAFGSGPWVFHGELGGSVTSAPALEGFDPIQAAQREGGST